MFGMVAVVPEKLGSVQYEWLIPSGSGALLFGEGSMHLMTKLKSAVCVGFRLEPGARDQNDN